MVSGAGGAGLVVVLPPMLEGKVSAQSSSLPRIAGIRPDLGMGAGLGLATRGRGAGDLRFGRICKIAGKLRKFAGKLRCQTKSNKRPRMSR